MKEWKVLLDYIDYYEYSHEEEKILIKDGELQAKAQFVYDQISSTYGIEEGSIRRWEFDIALDCIREMNEEDREYIRNNPEGHLYHFGYAMYIRNHYIHCRKKHHVLCADGTSGTVMAFIFTVLHPFYNCTNKNFMDLWCDYTYEDFKKYYAADHPIVIETAKRLSSPYSTETAQEAIVSLRKALRQELGEDYLKENLKQVVIEFYDDPTFARGENIEFLNALYRITRVFNREYNQIVALIALGVLSELKSDFFPKYKSVDELQQYLYNEVGFQEKDSQLLAECLWYAFDEAKKKKKEADTK